MLVANANRTKVPLDGADVTAGWHIGDIVVDPVLPQITRDGEAIALERSGHAILLHLAAHAGAVVAKDDLLRIGWPGRVVSENSLAKAISLLRRALGDDNAELIRVVHGFGYRLQATAMAETIVDAPNAAMPHATGSLWPWAFAMLAAVAVLLGVWAWSWSPRTPPAPFATVAVLPFVDASSDRSLGHLATGMSEQLRVSLATAGALRVLGRTSSQAPMVNASPQRIGRALGVEALIEGTLQADDARIRLTAALVRTRDGVQLWSNVLERPRDDLFAMQDELTSAVARELHHALDVRAAAPDQGRTRDPEAYELFLRARFALANSEGGQRSAKAYLEQAVARDPGYAQAWLGLANVLGHSGLYADDGEELARGREAAFAAIDRAIALAPGWVEPYLQRAEMRQVYRWDWTGAEADLAQAREIGGESVSYLIRRARTSAALGRLGHAVELGLRAAAIDPRSAAHTVTSWHYLALGDHERARQQARQAIALQPIDGHAWTYLGLAEALDGRAAEALAAFEHAHVEQRLIGTVIALSGRDEAAALRALASLQQRFPDSAAYQIAEARAWRGEVDAAFAALAHAHQVGDAGLSYLKFDPLLANLRHDPRYAAWLARLGLPAD